MSDDNRQDAFDELVLACVGSLGRTSARELQSAVGGPATQLKSSLDRLRDEGLIRGWDGLRDAKTVTLTPTQ